MTRTVVIVQARFNSTRLPGKVLLDLSGRTVLSRVLERCKAIKAADAVCCAVPDAADSDSVAEEAGRAGVTVFRGSEHDVLARFHGAAQMMNADVVLRVTSDCPLLDPAICSEVIRLRTNTGAAYACNNMPVTWPHGLDCEAVPFEWLGRAFHEAVDSFQREHVMPFIRSHKEAVTANLPSPDPALSSHRWTLDTPRDLGFMRAILKRLPEGEEHWNWQAPLAVVEADSTLSALNAGETTPAYHKSGIDG